MAYWHIPEFARFLFPGVIWNKRANNKTLYLTFDDGPTPEVTPDVLDILEKYKAKATFFCLGRNAERHQEIYQAVLKKGHSVGNHTYSHLKGWKTGNAQYYIDIELAGQFIRSKLFRPPYGQIRRSQLRYLKKNYHIVLWDILSHDYNERVSVKKSLKKIFRYTKDGSILVFHDSVKAWPRLQHILPRVLEHFSEQGYRFEEI